MRVVYGWYAVIARQNKRQLTQISETVSIIRIVHLKRFFLLNKRHLPLSKQ